jgi:hypothetical protein
MEKTGEIKSGVTPPEADEAEQDKQAAAEQLEEHLTKRAADEAVRRLTQLRS